MKYIYKLGQWFSGKIRALGARAPGSIPGWPHTFLIYMCIKNVAIKNEYYYKYHIHRH